MFMYYLDGFHTPAAELSTCDRDYSPEKPKILTDWPFIGKDDRDVQRKLSV